MVMTLDGSTRSRITLCNERIETSGTVWHRTWPLRSKMPKTIVFRPRATPGVALDATRTEIEFVGLHDAEEGRRRLVPCLHAQKPETPVHCVRFRPLTSAICVAVRSGAPSLMTARIRASDSLGVIAARFLSTFIAPRPFQALVLVKTRAEKLAFGGF